MTARFDDTKFKKKKKMSAVSEEFECAMSKKEVEERIKELDGSTTSTSDLQAPILDNDLLRAIQGQIGTHPFRNPMDQVIYMQRYRRQPNSSSIFNFIYDTLGVERLYRMGTHNTKDEKEYFAVIIKPNWVEKTVLNFHESEIIAMLEYDQRGQLCVTRDMEYVRQKRPNPRTGPINARLLNLSKQEKIFVEYIFETKDDAKKRRERANESKHDDEKNENCMEKVNYDNEIRIGNENIRDKDGNIIPFSQLELKDVRFAGIELKGIKNENDSDRSWIKVDIFESIGNASTILKTVGKNENIYEIRPLDKLNEMKQVHKPNWSTNWIQHISSVKGNGIGKDGLETNLLLKIGREEKEANQWMIIKMSKLLTRDWKEENDMIISKY